MAQKIAREVEDALVGQESVINPNKKIRFVALRYDCTVRTCQDFERETIEKYLNLVT